MSEKEINEAVERERERCVRCVESNMSQADEAIDALLNRIANQIRSGEEPLSIDEQMR